MNRQDQQPIAPIRFRFEHLGPVREAELELGNLTIIAGKNNTGKTYIAYTIYGLLKHFLLGTWMRMNNRSEYGLWINRMAQDRTSPLKTASVNKRRLNSNDILSHRGELLSEYSTFFSDTLLAGIFSSHRGDFDGARVSIHLSESPPNIKEDMKKMSQELLQDDPTYPFQFDGCDLSLSLPCSLQSRIGFRSIGEHLIDQYRRLLVPELSFDLSVISAERFGISLFYKELDFAKNQLVEALQQLRDKEYSSDEILYLISDRGSSRYALPIKDNIHFTREISQTKSREGELHNEKLFEPIEQMLDGSYSTSGDELRFHSMPHQKSCSQDSGFDVPLHLASSSARGLADLYFFLKHQAKHNHLLIIDEPESHLDTENQVQLARMLARFVRAGVRILITTHSDYLLKEINNLIMLSNDFKDKEDLRKSLGYARDDFLDPSLIRAYVAENGGLSPCEIDSIGIEFPLFDRVIDAINRASSELFTRMDN